MGIDQRLAGQIGYAIRVSPQRRCVPDERYHPDDTIGKT